MPTSRRAHKNGPTEEKSPLDVLEDLKKYLLGQRKEYSHDAKHMLKTLSTYDAQQAQLKGQLATIRVTLTWIKDRKKHLARAAAPPEKKTDWNAKRKAHLKNLWEIRERMRADAERIEKVVSGLTIDSVKQDEEEGR